MDGTPDGFLDKIRRQLSFLAETVIQAVSGFHIRGDTVFVVGVVPAVVTGLVRTVQELVGGFVEVVVILVGNDEFDRRGASDLYISDVVSTVLTDLGVGRLLSRGLCRRVSASARGLCPLARPEGSPIPRCPPRPTRFVLPINRKPCALSSRAPGPFGWSAGPPVPHDLRPGALPRNC